MALLKSYRNEELWTSGYRGLVRNARQLRLVDRQDNRDWPDQGNEDSPARRNVLKWRLANACANRHERSSLNCLHRHELLYLVCDVHTGDHDRVAAKFSGYRDGAFRSSLLQLLFGARQHVVRVADDEHVGSTLADPPFRAG